MKTKTMSYNDNILLIATVVMWWAGAVFAAMVNNFCAASLFVGNAALYLLSDLGTGMTGEIMHVDGGYHVVGMIKTSSAKQIAELLGNFEGE